MSRRPNSECQIMVFRPTMEEFSDFSRYIQYMESQGAHRGGVAKIIPPKEWSPCKSYDNIDNLIIPAPISQLVTGQKGLFTQYNIQQKPMTVKEMRRLTNTDRYSPPFHENYEDLERTYWKNITFNPAIYGADISGSLYDKDVDVWNVARLDTILDLVENDTGVKIEGVNTAYLYFGMWKTSFAWHTEDMDLYSINYVHFGAPKTWYSVPPEHGKRLERLACGFFPNSNSTCPSFLRHKMTLISPSVLRKYGIPFNKTTQEAGEFMITFPYGYHSGFNHGFNCAESTNFASERWINYGLAAEKCRCRKDMVYINMDIFIKTFQPDNYERWKMNKLEVKLSYVDIPSVPDFSKPPVHWRTRMKEIREGSGVTTQTPEKKVGSPTIIKRSPPFQRKEIIKKAFGNQKSPLIKIEKTPALSAVRFKEASPVKKSCKRSLSTSEVEGVGSSTPGTSGSLLTSTDVKPFQISMGTILPADALSEQLKNIIPEPCDYLPTLMDRVKMGRRKTHPDTTAFGDTSNRTLYNFTAALPPYSDHNMYTKPEPKMVAATATSYPPLPVRLQLPVHWTTLPKSDKSQSSVTTNTQAGKTGSQLVENVTSSESDVSGDQVTKLATVPESSKSSSNSVKVAKRPPLKRRHLVSKKGPSKKSSPTVLLKSAGADSSSEEESKSDKSDSKKSKGPSKARPETEGYPSLWPRQKSSMKIERQYNATVAKLPPYCAVCTLFQPYYQKPLSSTDEPPPALDDLLQKSQPQPLGTKTKPLIPETIFATTNDDPAPLATCELLDEEGKSLLIQCKACKVQVHASCYGIAKPTDPWTCDRCSFKAWIAQCSLCCMRGGALKPVNDGKHWAHILCAVAITEVFFDDIPRRDGINIKKISNTRQKLKCTYCRRSKQGGSQLLGTCIQCCSGSCAISFHSTCAHAAGVKMEPGDWPLPVFVYCHRHALLKEKAMEQKSEKSFPDVAVGQKVYGKHKNGRFYSCVIQHETSQNFHHVIFTDKSWSDNLFEQDIISHDFTVSAPKKGDVVSVKWIDGKTYEAEYVECKKHQVLTVEFEDGSSLNVKRQDVYTDMDEMPKRIRRKLSNATLQSRSDHFESPKKDVTEQSFVGQRAAINAQKKRKLHFTEEETSIKPSDAVVKNLESN